MNTKFKETLVHAIDILPDLRTLIESYCCGKKPLLCYHFDRNSWIMMSHYDGWLCSLCGNRIDHTQGRVLYTASENSSVAHGFLLHPSCMDVNDICPSVFKNGLYYSINDNLSDPSATQVFLCVQGTGVASMNSWT